MTSINGKTYPMWQGFIDKKDGFIGKSLSQEGSSTKITDVTLRPNGSDSAMFEVHGEDFSCGFDVSIGGITAETPGVITFVTQFSSFTVG